MFNTRLKKIFSLSIPLFLTTTLIYAQEAEVAYRVFPVVGSRTAIWVVAQLHLFFAAFVLAVPIIAVIIEFIGYKTGEKKYDDLAHEFTKLLSTAFSFTATFGAILTFMLLILYPKFTTYLTSIFGWTYLPYATLFFLEAGFLYSYYYGWGKFSSRVHLALGIGLNIVGTSIMLIANSWLTFMMTPAGISESGSLQSLTEAMMNFTWMPINIHRVIANVAFGGSIAGAYGAFKFLHAKTEGERAHYDWMGYTGNFIAISAFLPLPFAGYWLAKEIYAYSQNLGVTMMGGAFSWLFIIQAELIGILFLGGNVYLWFGMGRIDGSEKYKKFVKYLLAAVGVCFAIWATPSSLIMTANEAREIGGARHPILSLLGVMAAKNTAVNILILTTYISFFIYRRCGKEPIVSWARKGNVIQMILFAVSSGLVIFLGIYGYFLPAKERIFLSIPQVLSVILAMVVVTIIDVYMYKNAKSIGKVHWGKMPAMSQYLLLIIATSFTWLMGLMGYLRSGLRQHWHVYGVIRDTSVEAYTPTLGYATKVVSVTVLIFFAFLGLVFWLATLSGRPDYRIKEKATSS